MEGSEAAWVGFVPLDCLEGSEKNHVIYALGVLGRDFLPGRCVLGEIPHEGSNGFEIKKKRKLPRNKRLPMVLGSIVIA